MDAELALWALFQRPILSVRTIFLRDFLRCTPRAGRRVGRQRGRRAVGEGPRSNSVGFSLHNTTACVTTVAGDSRSIRPVARVKAQTRLCQRLIYLFRQQTSFSLQQSNSAQASRADKQTHIRLPHSSASAGGCAEDWRQITLHVPSFMKL